MLKQFLSAGLGVGLLLAATQATAVIQVPADEANLTDAIAAAAPGEEIRVANTFTDPLHGVAAHYNVANDIVVRSYDPTYTTPTPGAQTGRFETANGSDMTLVGLDILSGNFGAVSSVFNQASVIVVEDCTISGAGSGFFLPDASHNVTIRNTTISNNTYHGIEFVNGGGTAVVTCNMENVTLAGNGGLGILIQNQIHGTWDNVTISGTEFEGLIFAINGASRPDGTNLVLNDCTFDGNGVSPGNFGDGIRIDGQVTLTLNNCQIINGEADNAHGIFTLDGADGTVINLNDCLIDNNGNTNIMCDDGVTLNISGTTISNARGANGDGDGIFMFVDAGNTGVVNITDSVFEGNARHALNLNNDNGVDLQTTVARTVLRDGSAGAHFLVRALNASTAGDYAFLNCVLDEGLHQFHLDGGALDIAHCTLASEADASGIGVHVVNGTHTLRNSIIDGPTTAIQVDGGALANDYNLVNGTVTGATLGANSVANADPMFTTATTGVGTGNFVLLADSPAAGVGLDLGVSDDANGDARPLPAGSGPDMGAYESLAVPVELSEFTWQ